MSVPAGGGYYARTPQVDFGWLSAGWNLFQQRSGAWAGATLVVGLLSLVMGLLMLLPTGILAWYVSIFQKAMHSTTPSPSANSFSWTTYPIIGNLWVVYVGGFMTNIISTILFGGLFRMAYRHVEGEAVGVLDMFSVGDSLLPLGALGAIYGAISFVSNYTCGILALVFAASALFSPLIIVTRNVGAPTAIMESFRLLKSQWLMSVLFVFVGVLMVGVSSLLCGLGQLLTIPTLVLAIAVGYKSFTGAQFAAYQGYGEAVPGTWPPPPSASQPPYGQPPQAPYGQPQQPYGQPQPGPSFGQPPQRGPEPGWQAPRQGSGQPPQGGGQWPGDDTPGEDPNNRALDRRQSSVEQIGFQNECC